MGSYAFMITPQLPSIRPNAAVASAAAEGMDAPKANVDDAGSSSVVAEQGVPEDSDADPEADALVIGQQGLLSGSTEDGATKDKNADRPWIKNVRKNRCCCREKEKTLQEGTFSGPQPSMR